MDRIKRRKQTSKHKKDVMTNLHWRIVRDCTLEINVEAIQELILRRRHLLFNPPTPIRRNGIVRPRDENNNTLPGSQRGDARNAARAVALRSRSEAMLPNRTSRTPAAWAWQSSSLSSGAIVATVVNCAQSKLRQSSFDTWKANFSARGGRVSGRHSAGSVHQHGGGAAKIGSIEYTRQLRRQGSRTATNRVAREDRRR